ncbi:MAG: molybdopterin-dependent oxidoreductase [Rhodobacteraceae bacterium]|nr:molybdopterin-dependent oxidoreductase [Paracoccaceae bacterium]
MSVEFRKDLFADERDDDLNEVGKPTRRQDILGHVTGRSPFFDDHRFDGMLHIRCVRSPYHHARIRNIDTSRAETMPGVVRIMRGADVPVNLNTLLSLLDFGKDDEPVLAVDKVAYKGEPVLAIIAESEAQAHDAVNAVRVDYEELPHVLDVEEAIKPGAPSVNLTYPNNKFEFYGGTDKQKLRFGDVETGFARADYIVEGRYQMAPIEQAPIEPNGAIALPETNDRWACYTSTQGLFFTLGTAAKLLDVSSSRLHFIGGTVGGGFGGKVDGLCEPLAILGAMLTGRPVRYVLDRAEEMQVSAPRSAEVWYIKDGLASDGRIIARQFTGYFDSGAYTRLTSYGVVKCTGHLPGPYTIPNVQSDLYCVYTNRTPATAMRGFGVTGADFAIERHMDKGARAVGMGPLEFRLINAYRDGDMKAHRRLAGNCALIESIQAAAARANYPLTSEYMQMSSSQGGGGERAQIPATRLQDGSELPAGTRRIAAADHAPGLIPQVGVDVPVSGKPSTSATPAAPAPAQAQTQFAASPAMRGYGASSLGQSAPPPAPPPPAATPAAEASPPPAAKPQGSPGPRYSRYSKIGNRRR